VCCTPLAKTLRQGIENRLQNTGKAKGVLGIAWSILFYSVIPVILLLLSTASLVGDSYNPFIYFQF
jgi:alginate O-acetyltransferase complex protein AlgI